MVIVYVQNDDAAAFAEACADAVARYPGERVGGRNPAFYGSSTAVIVRDARAVYVAARWAQIIEDYRGLGVPVHVLGELGRIGRPNLEPPAVPPPPARAAVPAPAPAPASLTPRPAPRPRQPRLPRVSDA